MTQLFPIKGCGGNAGVPFALDQVFKSIIRFLFAHIFVNETATAIPLIFPRVAVFDIPIDDTSHIWNRKPQSVK